MDKIDALKKLFVDQRKRRNLVAATSIGLPTVSEWLVRIEAIGDPALSESINGIWCGREGRVVVEVSAKSDLIVGWYNGKVEYSYLT